MISFVLAVALGPRSIAWLKARFREPIKSASPDIARLHMAKQATPTMGGIFIVGGLIARHAGLRRLVQSVSADRAGRGGWRWPCWEPDDDLVKLRHAARGIRARTKLAAQTAIALAAALLVYLVHRVGGCRSIAAGAATRLARRAGLDVRPAGDHRDRRLVERREPGRRLGRPGRRLPGVRDRRVGAGGLRQRSCRMGRLTWELPTCAGAGEMLVVAAAMIGGVLGFLWFNCHPASVFMGDTGSLPLGGLLGLLAVIARQELLLVVIGGVFVVEAVSVIDSSRFVSLARNAGVSLRTVASSLSTARVA